MASMFTLSILNYHVELTNQLPHSQWDFTDSTALILIFVGMLSGAHNIKLSQLNFKGKEVFSLTQQEIQR